MKNYYELTVMTKVLEDIKYIDMFEKLSSFVSMSMLNSPNLKDLHVSDEYKGYVIGGLLPIEIETKTYAKGRIYYFNLRCVKLDTALGFKRCIETIKSNVFSVVTVNMTTQNYRFINVLKNNTPFVHVVNGKTWTQDDDLETLINGMHDNLVKKCKQFIPDFTEPRENFIDGIEFLNKKPIKIPYKNGFVFGHKCIITVKADSTSQQIAYMAMASGLLTKNTLGFGFCSAK